LRLFSENARMLRMTSTRVEESSRHGRRFRGVVGSAMSSGQRAVFGFGPLATARSAQHVEIAHGALTVLEICRGKFRHYPLDQYQLAARRKRIPTLAQDDPALFVIPVVDDAFHQNRVGAASDSFEEVARDEPAAVGNLKSIESFSRPVFAARKIEGYSLRPGLWRSTPPISSTDTHYDTRGREIICLNNSGNEAPC
jgi:hypothetical protein